MEKLNHALNELKEGNARFVSGNLKSALPPTAARANLVEKQEPSAIVLSCSDSRLPPEHVFDQGLGKLFTIRVAGNVLNAEAIASIEYAVTHLGSKLIVIMGHDSCGAIKAAINTPEDQCAGSPSLNDLLRDIRQNLEGTHCEEPTVRKSVKKNVSAVAKKLMERSRIVRDALKSGEVRLQEALYNLSSGHVEFQPALMT